VLRQKEVERVSPRNWRSSVNDDKGDGLMAVNSTSGPSGGGSVGGDSSDFGAQMAQFKAQGEEQIQENMEFSALQNKISTANKIAGSRPGQ
jgi:hypothetical protein